MRGGAAISAALRARSIWTPELKKRVAALWADPTNTAKEIAAAIGVNKDQVIGCVHRMGLPKRRTPPGLAASVATRQRRKANARSGAGAEIVAAAKAVARAEPLPAPVPVRAEPKPPPAPKVEHVGPREDLLARMKAGLRRDLGIVPALAPAAAETPPVARTAPPASAAPTPPSLPVAPATAPVAEAPAPPAVPRRRAPIPTLFGAPTTGGCLWISGDPLVELKAGRDPHCGKPVAAPGEPYCPHHRQRARVRPPQRGVPNGNASA